MSLAAEMSNTISLIKNFWPDLKFDKSDVVNGNPDFIFDFYSAFIAEFKDKMSYLLNEEIINEFDDIQEFEPQVVLYCNVARVLRKMKSSVTFVISLGDFYFPNPKKMYHCIQVCIHFVVFINNCLDEVSIFLNKNFKKLIEFENFKELKQQYTQENAEFAEKYGESLTESDKLKSEIEKAKKEYEKMLDDKKAEDKLILDMSTEINKLQVDVDNLEYEWKLLEDKENNLVENVVTQEEYNSLISTERYLQFELEQLNNSIEIKDKKRIEDIEQFEDNARLLSEIFLDSLPVEVVHQHKIKNKTKGDRYKHVTDDLAELNNITEIERKKLKELEKQLEDTISLFNDFTGKMRVEEDEAKKSIAFEAEKCAGYFQLILQRRSDNIRFEEEEKEIEIDECTLRKEIAIEYEKILNAGQKTTKNFYNMLKRLTKE